MADFAVEYLAAGQTRVESFTISLDDQHGGVITKQIDVTITGTNDAPILAAAAATGSVTEQGTPTSNLTSTGSIGFTDVDLTDVQLSSTTAVGTPLGTLMATKAVDTTGTGRRRHRLELQRRRQCRRISRRGSDQGGELHGHLQ